MTNKKSVISYITIGVTDLTLMRQFYSALGFVLHAHSDMQDHPYVMYRSGVLVLALYPKHLLAKQAGCSIAESDKNSAMSLSLNVKSKVTWLAAIKSHGRERSLNTGGAPA